MADAADMASVIEDEHRMRGILAARTAIPAGVAGECEGCFEDSPRLVDGRCARCRDGRTRVAPIVRRVEVATQAWCGGAGRGGADVGGHGGRGDQNQDRENEMTKISQRTVTFQASGEVLDAIEAQAAAMERGLGPAALALLTDALEHPAPAVTPGEAGPDFTPRQRMAMQLLDLQVLLTEQIEAAERGGDTEALEERLGAEIAARQAVEAKLAQLKAVLS